MPVVPVASRRAAGLPIPACLGLLLAIACASQALAQPAAAAPEAYGDRQAGVFSDPGTGVFGNPAAGHFDSDRILTPPPGTRPLGRVLDGRATEPPPYVTLPDPPAEAPKPAKKKTSRRQEARRGS